MEKDDNHTLEAVHHLPARKPAGKGQNNPEITHPPKKNCVRMENKSEGNKGSTEI